MTDYTHMQLKHQKLVESLVKFSKGLDEKVVDYLLAYAECLLTPDSTEISEVMFCTELTEQFGLTNRLMISLIFDHLKMGNSINNMTVPLENYCKLVCIFLTPNLDVKINFAFSIFDLDKNGFVERTEVQTLLRPTVHMTEDEHEDSLRELVDIVMRTVDRDKDALIFLQEFRELVKKNVLYIELLGQCLPDKKYVNSFRRKLSQAGRIEVRLLFEAEIAARSCLSATSKSFFSAYYPIPLEF